MVEQLGVIGCGLMGGSFALALRQAGQVRRIVGYSRRPESTERARGLGVIDEVAESPAQAAVGSDLVLLAVPVASTGHTLAALREALEPQALCMDVGSTKQDVVVAATAALAGRLNQFVPAHPIAGSERAGVEHAQAGLYRDRLVILTPQPGHVPLAVQRAQRLWQAVGARVQQMDPQAHDRAFAAVSHLPHLLAYAFFESVAGQPEGHALLELAGPGFRDFTRIAAGEPLMWRDILLANREEVLRQAAAFRVALDGLEALMKAGDGDALRARLAGIAQRRGAWQMRGADEAGA
ncbi:MAG: prephenate dehydrogenase [Rubrivivax sp.]